MMNQVWYEDIKGTRWMPWHRKPMKDVTSCDKPRGGAHTRYHPWISEWENLSGVMLRHLHLNT